MPNNSLEQTFVHRTFVRAISLLIQYPVCSILRLYFVCSLIVRQNPIEIAVSPRLSNHTSSRCKHQPHCNHRSNENWKSGGHREWGRCAALARGMEEVRGAVLPSSMLKKSIARRKKPTAADRTSAKRRQTDLGRKIAPVT